MVCPGRWAGDVARSIGEPRTVIQIAARRDMPRKIEIEPGVERMALIVVQQEIAAGGRREIGQAAADTAPAPRA